MKPVLWGRSAASGGIQAVRTPLSVEDMARGSLTGTLLRWHRVCHSCGWWCALPR
jgi:hypothetical protein